MRSMSKYRNKKTGGFDSKMERDRYLLLRMMEETGEITDLKCQVKFELIPAQYIDGKCVERKCEYVADFTYYQDGSLVVEDVKGFRTDVYKLKRKMMLYLRGIRVKECGR